jgi:hypothetical protein
MRRDVALGLGAGLLGGGVALLGAALLGAFKQPEQPLPMIPAAGYTSIFRVVTPAPPERSCFRFEQHPPDRDYTAELADRARRVRVLVYRIDRGELTLASPEVDADISTDVADQLEGHRPTPPSAAAEGALPLDWQ